MRRRLQRGIAYIEFALSLMVLMPLFLGVIGLGLSMHRQLQTVQLVRDAGHMFARGIDFTLSGNQQVLAGIAGSPQPEHHLGLGRFGSYPLHGSVCRCVPMQVRWQGGWER